MIRCFLALGLLAGSTLVHAAFPLEIFEYLDNVKLVAFIPESDIDESTDWQPGQGKPPLDIPALSARVNQYLQEQDIAGTASIERIELRPLPHRESHWHYLVMLQLVTGGRTQNQYLFILMNGKVIPAIKEPESYK